MIKQFTPSISMIVKVVLIVAIDKTFGVSDAVAGQARKLVGK